MLAKTGPVTYKIQRHPQAEPDIVHVDKLMPYYPDFGEELRSWIETDNPTRYRDQGEQTTRPTLQSQVIAVVDIPPQEPDASTDPEGRTPPPGSPDPALETEERLEANTTLTTETEKLPLVLETRLEPSPARDCLSFWSQRQPLCRAKILRQTHCLLTRPNQIPKMTAQQSK